MKPIKKKSMRLTMCSILLLTSLLSMAQVDNKIIFTIADWNKTGDSVLLQTDSCNLTTLKEASQLTVAALTKLILYYNNPRMLNPEDNKIYNNQYIAAQTDWGTTAVNNFAIGNYNSYLTYDQRSFHKLYFSSQTLYNDKRYEFILRCRHELYARTTTLMDALIGDRCIGWASNTGFIVGGLYSYSFTTGIALLETSEGNGTLRIVDVNCISEADSTEISKYY